jgi:glycosyltransferase involved in cell wall biosynthesis
MVIKKNMKKDNFRILHVSNDLVGGIGNVILNLRRVFENGYVLSIDIGFKSFLKKFYQKKILFEVLHFHGAWTLHLLPLMRKLIQPTIVSPHGAFDKTSLTKSKYKKLLVKFLYMKRCYLNADCIHALTEKEAKDIRDYGIKDVPIFIIPNGINLEEELPINKNLKSELLELANNRKIVLSLSRLHIAKGIDLLIESYKNIYDNNPNTILLIVGSGEKKYEQHLREKLKKLNLTNNVFLLSKKENEDKNTMYDIADIFVLPTFNEGFGITVLEAYRQKVPVITTTVTPFDEIKKQNLGWYINPTKEDLITAIDEALNCEKCELREMGTKGYSWVEKNYTSSSVNEKYTELYGWLLNKSIAEPRFKYKDNIE